MDRKSLRCSILERTEAAWQEKVGELNEQLERVKGDMEAVTQEV